MYKNFVEVPRSRNYDDTTYLSDEGLFVVEGIVQLCELDQNGNDLEQTLIQEANRILAKTHLED